jgi:hypothetical protein
MVLPGAVDLLFCGDIERILRGVRAGILSLRIATLALIDGNKWYEIGRVFAHELTDILADLCVFALVSVKLIREGIK